MRVFLIEPHRATAEALADPLWIGSYDEFVTANRDNSDADWTDEQYATWARDLERYGTAFVGGGASAEFMLVTEDWATTRQRATIAFTGVAAAPVGWTYVDTSTPETDAAKAAAAADALHARGFRVIMPLKD